MPAPETPPAKLPPAPVGLTIVDACAGAGGKSLALADAIGGKGRIYSYDVSKTKLDALRRRATKAGVNCIQAVVLKDGHESDVISKFQSTADVVLVDAPCSGWGVLKRNADIKWRQEQDYLERMPATQLRLLSTFSQLVKPGGRLVYGLCTFRAAETTEVIEKFLETHPEFEKRSGGFIGPGSSDGFFVQVLERRK